MGSSLLIFCCYSLGPMIATAVSRGETRGRGEFPPAASVEKSLIVALTARTDSLFNYARDRIVQSVKSPQMLSFPIAHLCSWGKLPAAFLFSFIFSFPYIPSYVPFHSVSGATHMRSMETVTELMRSSYISRHVICACDSQSFNDCSTFRHVGADSSFSEPGP